jgi:hypothetical protein
MNSPRRLRAAAFAVALTTVLVAGMTGTALAVEDMDCSDFTYQEDAQAVLDQDTSDPHRLDGGQGGPPDGIACETLPRRGNAAEPGDSVPTTPATAETPPPVATTPQTTAPQTTPPQAPEPTTTQTTAPELTPAAALAAGTDRDCPDFATQADAQAALESRAGDPERLDADGDGIACEQHFGTEGRQVAVVPLGGVATGGTPQR